MLVPTVFVRVASLSAERSARPIQEESSGNDDQRLTIPVTWPAGVDKSAGRRAPEQREVVFDINNSSRSSTDRRLNQRVDLEIYKNVITAFIGPSGSEIHVYPLSQPHERSGAWRESRRRASLPGTDIYALRHRSGQVRRRIGMVFQRPIRSRIHLRQRRLGPARCRDEEHLDERVERH